MSEKYICDFCLEDIFESGLMLTVSEDTLTRHYCRSCSVIFENVRFYCMNDPDLKGNKKAISELTDKLLGTLEAYKPYRGHPRNGH